MLWSTSGKITLSYFMFIQHCNPEGNGIAVFKRAVRRQYPKVTAVCV